MSVCSTLNWKLDMFVFEEIGKLEYLEKKPFEAWGGENQLTNSNHTCMVSTLGLEPRILW